MPKQIFLNFSQHYLIKRNTYIIKIYLNLQQAVRLGVQISKIYRCLKFRQSPWLEKYINLNTKLCQMAKNDFEKNFLN